MVLTPGDTAPWFVARSTNNPQFHFDTAAGRPIVLCLFGTAADPLSQRILQDFRQVRDHFDDDRAAFFGVSIDPEDERQARVSQDLPGIRFFWDFDQKISRLYGALSNQGESGQTQVVTQDSGEADPSPSSAQSVRYLQMSVVLDARLRAAAVIPFCNEPERHVSRVMEAMNQLPPAGPASPAAVQAPILVVPSIFEAEFCRELIQQYEQAGGQESGFMVEQAGKTVMKVDYGHKQRSDFQITDERTRQGAMVRIHRRLAPEALKAFQFHATRMERYIVACYDAQSGGYFRPHRDNTTRGTAHRRFAVSLNLNAEEYEGGDLRFPEFGAQTYRPPTGGAVVFSCSLLHEATPVISGKRYAFLPFLYDEAAAKIREQNNQFLGDNVAKYKTDSS